MDKLKKVEEPENLNFIKFNQNFKEKFWQIDAIKDNRFLRYKITETGISSYTYPGIKNGEFIASSYEHTQSWATTEDPDYKVKMTRKRHLKLQQIWKNEDDFTWFKIFNKKAKKFLVTVWLSSITCMEFIKKYPWWWLIILTVLNPINPSLKSFIDKNVDELVFVELNYSWQLQSYLSCKLGLNCEKWKWKIRSVRKYNNYPLFIEDLENEVLW
jgi:2-oxoglutarate ferredoxin oxidoreductase subunit alpha